MVARPILEIDLDDSAFTRFLDTFHHYEDELKTLPQHWQASGREIEHQKTSFEKISSEVAKVGAASSVAEVAQVAGNKVLDAAAASLGLLSTHGKHFAANIVRSTQSLMKWTKLTSVFSGLLGAGGLYGINRMAASAAGQRTSAMGLGVSYGEQASFLTNFGPLGNPAGILQGFSAGLSDPVGKAQIAHLIGHRPTGDAAETAAEALPKFKEFVDKTPDAQLGPLLKTFGYDKLGLGVEQAKAIRGMSREEIEGRARDYREGKTSALALDPATAKKWTEFTTQMERASWQLENVFAKDLVKLTPGLTHLSDSFVHLVDNLLKDGSPIKGWIDSLGKGLDNFAETMGSRGFQQGVSIFIRDSTKAIHLIEQIVATRSADASAIAGIGVAAYFGGGTATAMGTWLARAVGAATLEASAIVAGSLFLKYGNPRQRQSIWDGAKPADPRNFTVTSTRPGGSSVTPTNRFTDPSATPSQNELSAVRGSGARTMSPGGPGSLATSPSVGYGTGKPSPLDVIHGTIEGVDKRLLADVAAGASHLPEGYQVKVFSGFRAGDPGAHGRGQAIDVEIVDPKGNVIPSRGADTTHMYERLAKSVYGEMRVRDPDLAEKKFAWGGSFGTQKGGGGESDLMHFDIMGRRGGVRASHFKQVQELGELPLEKRTLTGYGHPAALSQETKDQIGPPRLGLGTKADKFHEYFPYGGIGTHPADLERGKPIGAVVVDHTGGSAAIDVTH